ncbi:hypothetical protein JQ625_27305 [Bradyrhizobium diazoefficiens]|nr:hypothetical protein [Bradyrhizobium diazoefficiens]MBR0778557.1 hypothetical protein [Bradyrhizobium diazoefficiens]
MIETPVQLLRTMPTPAFLKLLGFTSTGLSQRTYNKEVSFAFGGQINAIKGEYLELDALAALLTSLVGHRAKSLKDAAAAVRMYWREWLALVQECERDPRYTKEIVPGPEQHFFAVGVVIDSKGRTIVCGTGSMSGCLTNLYENYRKVRPDGGLAPSIFPVSMEAVLHQLRTNSRENKVPLRLPLTMQPDDPKYPQWLDEIEAHRQIASARIKTTAAKIKRQRAMV